MLRSSVIVFIVLTLAPLFSGDAPAQQPGESAGAAISTDEQQVRQSALAFVERYNARKSEELAALFAPEGRMVMRDGTELQGRAELQAAFAASFANHPRGAINLSVEAIRFLSADVAEEEGRSTFFADGETPTTSSRYFVVHVKRQGQWLMESARVVAEENLSAYDQLRPLEWMIGDWVDEGSDDVVETNCRWDENKNFILQEFQVVRAGQVVMKGTQRIGWDPQAEQIRSWIFDSSGGFGEGVWSRSDDGWVCQARGVLADGSTASACRRLRMVSNDLVIWSSTDRRFGNETLPDLAVTMARRPATHP